MKVVSIVGARPEFVQALPISRALRSRHQEVLVHTGQHYDYIMSRAFCDHLDIPQPAYDLGVGSGSHAVQTARALERLEGVLIREQPDLVLVRGDTNSTLAAALAAAKLQIQTAHVEAGERCHSRLVPEELNRIAVDHLCQVHLCASRVAVRQLSAEGIVQSVHWVGDVMLDALLYALPLARRTSTILTRLGLRPGGYALVTVHRSGTTDCPDRLRQLASALNQVREPVVFPVHPRTADALGKLDVHFEAHVRRLDPVGYLEMLVLEENARLIATDSGGVQREAYYLGVPCLTLRPETEWVETVDVGWNTLVGTDAERIVHAWSTFTPPAARPPIYGDGTAARRIVDILEQGKPGEPCADLDTRPSMSGREAGTT